MNFKSIILLSVFLQFTVACGGGGGQGAGKISPSSDPLEYDLDGVSSDTSIGLLAVSSNEVENSHCFAELPTFKDLNEAYYMASITPPLDNFYFNYVMGENDFGATQTKFEFLGQNQNTYELLNSLLFNVKKPNPIDPRRPPVIEVSNNKPIYESIRSFCNDVQCTADSVYGESWGLRFLFKNKFGLILSGLISEETDEYLDDEYLYSVAKAVLSLPAGTFPLNKDNYSELSRDYAPNNLIIAPYKKGFVPSENSKGAAGVMISHYWGQQGRMLVSNADIYLLDPWVNTRDFNSRVATVFHELIHVLDVTKEKGVVLSDTREWQSLSDWKFNFDDTWTMGKSSTGCSNYGTTQPSEDFAECGSLYRFAPLKLKKISKKKYNFFKNRVFGGVEYIQRSKCADSVEQF